MPIYEYKCVDCGIHIEKRQSVSEAPLAMCESCGGRLEKQWSLSGFQFKGDGWYVTDYSKNKNIGRDNADNPAQKTSGGESTPAASTASNEKSTETKAEKPATKT